MGFMNGMSAIGLVGFVDGVIGDGVGWWVSWMGWVSGSTMACVTGSAMA